MHRLGDAQMPPAGAAGMDAIGAAEGCTPLLRRGFTPIMAHHESAQKL
jgi:hypothetical protein